MRFIYPGEKEKALTFSYDDGQIHDRKLVEILNRHGLRGTFHLNSGTLAQDRQHNVFICSDEVAELFAGHEVAVHGVQHRNLPTLTGPQVVNEILEDRRTLEKLSGGLVQGMSYAFGNYSEEVIHILKISVSNIRGLLYPLMVFSRRQTSWLGIPLAITMAG